MSESWRPRAPPDAESSRPATVAIALTVTIALVLTALLVSLPAAAYLAGRAAPPGTPSNSVSEPASVAPAFPTPIEHVVVVLMENQNYSTVLADGPFEAYLARTYAVATNDYSVHHYSVPSYLAATSGIDDVGFSTYSAANIGDLADAADRSWAAFEQGMPYPCDTTTNWADGYDVDHNPFVMYKDIADNATRCDAHDLTWSSWTGDVAAGTIPNYSFVTPNTTNDDHNSTIPVGDAWLKSWLSPLLNDSTIFTDTAFLISYDESGTDSSPTVNGSSGGQVYTVVVSPYSRALSSDTFYNTFSLLTTAEWLLGLPGGTLGSDSWTEHSPMYGLFAFSPPLFSADFVQSGLASATEWTVTLDEFVQTVAGSSMTFMESNGTYPFSIAPPTGWVVQPSSGTVTVDGGASQVALTFARAYSLTFREAGLPTGTEWNVTVGSSTESSTSASIIFTVENGTYAYALGIVPGWKTADTGSVVVRGANVIVPRTFVPMTYVVTFKDPGLPTDTLWNVTVDGSTIGSELGYINFHLTNGSYSYNVSNVANYSRVATGTVTVAGSPLTVITHFTLVRYVLTFKDSGLPAGTNWSVTVGSATTWSTRGFINFHVPNGTYSYTVANIANYSRAASGTVTVAGGPLTVIEKFSLVRYVISFKDPGLPAGTNWSVTVGSTTVWSTLGFLNFHLPNGTYSYSVGAQKNYSDPGTGNFSVLGSGSTIFIPFTPEEFPVTLGQRGLTAGPPEDSVAAALRSVPVRLT
jgi:Phosphoesterase family